jgi:hypothetical protein
LPIRKTLQVFRIVAVAFAHEYPMRIGILKTLVLRMDQE